MRIVNIFGFNGRIAGCRIINNLLAHLSIVHPRMRLYIFPTCNVRPMIHQTGTPVSWLPSLVKRFYMGFGAKLPAFE